VDLRLCFQDRTGYACQRLAITFPPGSRQALPCRLRIFSCPVSDCLLPSA
jgi:hypothetical protein